MDYYKAGIIKDKVARENAIRAADRKMIAAVKKIEAAKGDHPWNIKQAKLIVAKVALEDLGVLDKGKFQQFDEKAKESDVEQQTGDGRRKKSNPWITHVKKYKAKHGCSYKEAMSLAKASYRVA